MLVYFLKFIGLSFFILLGVFATNKVIKHVKEIYIIYKENKKYYAGAIFEKNIRPHNSINPFYDNSDDFIRCEILDIKENKYGETWIKFRYLTTNKFFDHNNDKDNKISNVYSETLNKFKKRFKIK